MSPPRTPPHRLRRWTPLLASLVLAGAPLVGCTGTEEQRAPVLLVVGYRSGSTGQLALIEDTFNTETTTSERLRFLGSSPIDLDAPPVAFDIVDRAGARGTLAVLTRQPTAPFASEVVRVNLAGIRAQAPDAFAEIGPPIDVSQRLTDTLGPDDYCPDGLQVSRDGRFLAVFDDRAACGLGTTQVNLYLIDLTEDTVDSLLAADGLPVPPYLDQAGGRIFVATSAAGDAEIVAFPLDDPDDATTVARVSEDDQVDLGPVGDALLTLRPNAFQVVAADTETVATGPSARLLVQDALRNASQVVVLTSGRLVIHTSLGDDDPADSSVSAVAGTIESGSGFAYLVGSGRVVIVDLLGYTDELEDDTLSGRVRSFTIAEIPTLGEGDGLITWTLGVLDPE